MGVYHEQVLPRLVNVLGGMQAVAPHRARACAGLHGRVLEIGFGSGLNIPFYPPAVTAVCAVEPSDVAWKLAQDRVAGAQVPIERVGLDGQSVPLPDDSCDTALSTFTLCTIPDVRAALGELRRVLKPGGTLHFFDHGLAPDEEVQRWQHRLDPLQTRLFGGCHLTRPITGLLREAGFELHEVEQFYEKGSPKVMGADSLGVAVSP
ncbi:class I SAM-dependent methyltransferase [Amycolatopsis viridis]|uniref:Ubiquinone/menaquinone biosynthesis C-methylase UbiE n=1 Tax=Amycolatopsis viridis TaxID=185678 RepID=A0ABX0SXT2_9PSEU|nr:class I SAM-dependent methyltransferase [Amycolatopsis viridis]NIH80121.1 ubiquinone/menaquinone biosynthesis C-methylase UbiE [Amycolatopsis viridis]